MRILFEQHQYDATCLDGILQDIITGVELDFTKKARVDFVGYFYCADRKVQDCVFILPKVLLKDDDELGDVIAGVEYVDENGGKHKVTPENIITKEGQEKYLTKEYRKFLYEFSVWVYRCLCMYRKLNPDENSIYHKQLPQEGGNRKHEARTFLDIILSLIRFNKENQNFFMFTIKNQHSGMNKINWTKTISHSQAFIQNGTPMYMKLVNKKRRINFDEELFVIFFSILNYLNEQYGFRIPLNCNYELITGRTFDNYINHLGARKLKQIKYKYFSDKAIELWDLCYAFFVNTHRLNVSTDQKEYLLARKFEHVFEAMIDELIGAPRKDIPKGLKDQEDGKQVDHMYSYKSLTSHNDDTDEEIYYIGDSKYYKSGHKLGPESVSKQYTYARNVIQWNIDLWLNNRPNYWTDETRKDYNEDKAKFGKIRLRKGEEDGNVTEGYNVIPNFFLSAFVADERKYNAGSDNIRLHNNKEGEHSTYISYQFENRLFDRDTLILSHYDVNFLYVMYLYARNKASEKNAWKEEVRKIFRDEIRSVLQQKYDFYAMKPHDGDNVGLSYIKKNFQRVLGKVYTPYPEHDIYSVALSRDVDKQENDELLQELRKYFYVTEKPIELGDDPQRKIEDVIKTYGRVTHRSRKQGILVGLVPDDAHLKWIKDNSKYNIRYSNNIARNGSIVMNRDYILVNSVVLYRLVDNKPKMIGMFDILDENILPTIYKYEDMKRMEIVGTPYPYRTKDENERKQIEYIIYEIDANNPHPLTDKDEEYYSQLISEYGAYEYKGQKKIGQPFII